MTRSRLPRALLPVLWISMLALLAGCSRETDAWRAAQAADTVAAYQQFVRDHPASAHAVAADARAAQLAEDEDWRRAQEQDTLQAYQIFLSQHPDSRWAQEARVRVETITLGSGAPVVEPAPDPAPAAIPVLPAPPAGAIHGVQLGAFTSEAAARGQWTAMAGRHAAQLKDRSPRVTSVTTATGTLYRLQTPTRDEAEARALCGALSAAGQDCVVVHP
jgi:hypothetical protein